MKIVLKTKRNYVKYHRLLWNEIIKYINEHDVSECISVDHDSCSSIKVIVFNKLFDNNISNICNYCFGCQYSELQNGDCCKHCLFQFKNFNSCLGGIYSKFEHATTNKEAIKYATIIRDFPIRKD